MGFLVIQKNNKPVKKSKGKFIDKNYNDGYNNFNMSNNYMPPQNMMPQNMPPQMVPMQQPMMPMQQNMVSAAPINNAQNNMGPVVNNMPNVNSQNMGQSVMNNITNSMAYQRTGAVAKKRKKKTTPKSESVGSLNSLNEMNSESKQNVNTTVGEQVQNNGPIQTEISIFEVLSSSLIRMGIALVIIILVFLIVMENVDVFPHMSIFQEAEFNGSLARCFVILSVALLFVSILMSIVIIGTVKKLFNNRYLNKISVYIYDGFICIVNLISYVTVAYFMFNMIDDLYQEIVKWNEAGTIIGDVNIETINVFKYVIVTVVAIFIVLNSFSGIGVIHKNSKVAFENSV